VIGTAAFLPVLEPRLLDHRVIIHAPDASSAKANLSSSWLRRIANFRNALKDLFAIQPSDGIVSAQLKDIREVGNP
jgi:hypothetical protein